MKRDDYIQQMIGLMPTGQAWNTETSSNIMALLGIIASELAFIHERADTIIREALPNSTLWMLPDWEAAAGLPDNCSVLADTLPERIEALVSKVTMTGGQSRQYYIDLATRMGYQITIYENTPFMCGISHCGTDPLTEDHNCRFVWTVTVLNAKLLYLYCGQSTIDQPLLDFREADDLACMLQKLKPAHTELIIGYEGV